MLLSIPILRMAAGCSGGTDDTGLTLSAGSGTGGSGSGTGGAGGGAPECATAADCTMLFGTPACGTWACNAGVCEAQSPGCTDADGDGYGSGPNCTCTSLDCDDNDDTIGADGTYSCYSGPAGTAGVGTCLAGTRTCTAGVITPCVGEVTPSGEACNNL